MLRSLAARLRRLEQQAQGTAEAHGQGIASVLAQARRLPPHDPATLPQGLSQLLQEARKMLEKPPPMRPEHSPTD